MIHLRIAICDDDELILKKLCEIIEENFERLSCDLKVSTFSNAYSLVDSNCINRFDIIFLDIDMPKFNGIDAAMYIKYQNADTVIIFVTSKDDLVFDSLKAQPFRFLRKSKLLEEISAAITEIYKLFDTKAYILNIKIESKEYQIDANSILYIESRRNDIIIHTVNHKEFKFRDSINKKDEEVKNYGFIRVHNAYLVNQKYIYSIKGDFVILKDKIEIPVSRSKKSFVQQKLLEYLR